MERMRDVRPVHGEQPFLNHSLPSALPPHRPAEVADPPARTMDAIAERIIGRRRTMRRGEVARHAGVPLERSHGAGAASAARCKATGHGKR